jgi:hypothetical protein
MGYVRTPEREREWWRNCRVCEKWFFWLIIPFLLAAALLGWLWSVTHAFPNNAADFGAVWLVNPSYPASSPTPVTAYPEQEQEPGILLEPGHWRCRKTSENQITFERIENGMPGSIILDCTNCTCSGEK